MLIAFHWYVVRFRNRLNIMLAILLVVAEYAENGVAVFCWFSIVNERRHLKMVESALTHSSATDVDLPSAKTISSLEIKNLIIEKKGSNVLVNRDCLTPLKLCKRHAGEPIVQDKQHVDQNESQQTIPIAKYVLSLAGISCNIWFAFWNKK